MRERIVAFLANWPWHIVTAFSLLALYKLGPRQMPLVVYKATLSMVGACGGYWLFVCFFGRDPEFGDEHDRWQTVALMCAVMLTMSMAA